MSELHFRNYADLVSAVRTLAAKLPPDVDAVLGVPRSGMIAASLLAVHMNLPLGVAGPEIKAMTFASGRRIGATTSRAPVVLEDSAYTGASLRASVAAVEGCDRVIPAAVYVSSPDIVPGLVWAEEVPSPRVFEWNLFGSEMIRSSLLDIDGVLCPDPTMPEEDEEAYAKFLETTPPLHRPLFPVGGLVTNRLEIHREVTERWLARNGIQYESLRMAPFRTPSERRRHSTPVALKSAWYSMHGMPGILVESNDRIGAAVALNTGMPVITTDSMRLWK